MNKKRYNRMILFIVSRNTLFNSTKPELFPPRSSRGLIKQCGIYCTKFNWVQPFTLIIDAICVCHTSREMKLVYDVIKWHIFSLLQLWQIISLAKSSTNCFRDRHWWCNQIHTIIRCSIKIKRPVKSRIYILKY